MKKTIFALAFLVCTMLIGCGKKDAEIIAFTNDFDKLTNDIKVKIKAVPTKEGLEEAQKILDIKKMEMKVKLDELKQLRGYQVDKSSSKTLTQSLTKNLTAINQLKIEYMDESMNDKDFGEKLNKLVIDFNTISGV